MTATVLSADGRQIVLSPTGVDALRHVHRAHVAGGWVGCNSMHAASRQKLLDAGLIDQHQPNGRNATAITLTAEGWKFIGRTPPASIGRPVAAVPDAPSAPRIPDLGPIERRPFDPDRVRQGSAGAL